MALARQIVTATSDPIDVRCVRLLREHVAGGTERSRHAAYELGREALEAGLGVLDVATTLVRSTKDLLLDAEDRADRTRIVAALGAVSLEVLSPFEMAHRGAREANAAVRRSAEAREQEMKRIAHAIHDEAGHLLVWVHWAVDDALRTAPAEEREKLRVVNERLAAVEERLRQISYELRPTILDDLGLEPALRFLADGVSRRAGMPVTVEGMTGSRLPARVETVIYRAAQEAVNNAVRHAHAKSVVIRLRRSRGAVQCSIRDDGVGFREKPRRHGAATSGLGLIGIRERVAHVGGAVEIRSASRRGTEVLVQIPLGVSHRASNPARG